MRIVLRYGPFEILFAGQPRKRFAITMHVVTVQEPLPTFRYDPTKPKLAIAEGEAEIQRTKQEANRNSTASEPLDTRASTFDFPSVAHVFFPEYRRLE